MVQIQLDFPDEYDKLLTLYKINGDHKTKADALIQLAIEGLQPEKKVFEKDATKTEDKLLINLNRPEGKGTKR